MKTRTRFAPSPTGMMHIGNLRTAIFSYLVAKHDNGDFLLRIEDTDQTRKVEGAIDFIYDTLRICNINIDEGPNNEGNCGPYIQSERKEIYKKYALELVEKGAAYYCFCNEDRLNDLRKKAELKKIPFMYDGYCKRYSKEEAEKKIANGEPYVVRQNMPKYGETRYEDLVYGQIVIQNNTLEDQILLKSDGFPTYNFANVVDDHLMGITHVMRGNEYLSQTAKYNLLYESFSWESPQVIHVPMVLGEDGNKLSKRNGDASFMDLYNEGYLPNAIVNYLILLGWSPEDNEEVMTMDELIKKFDPKRISKAPAQYDKKKLQWMNSIYIKNMNDEEYLSFIKKYLEEAYDLSSKSNDWVNHLLLIYKNHISYGKNIIEETQLFFENDINPNEECKEFMNSDSCITDVIKSFKEEIENISNWQVDAINNAINNVKEKTGTKGKLLYMPIRIKISGIMHGPELPDTIYLIGKEKVLERLGN